MGHAHFAGEKDKGKEKAVVSGFLNYRSEFPAPSINFLEPSASSTAFADSLKSVRLCQTNLPFGGAETEFRTPLASLAVLMKYIDRASYSAGCLMRVVPGLHRSPERELMQLPFLQRRKLRNPRKDEIQAQGHTGSKCELGWKLTFASKAHTLLATSSYYPW